MSSEKIKIFFISGVDSVWVNSECRAPVKRNKKNLAKKEEKYRLWSILHRRSEGNEGSNLDLLRISNENKKPPRESMAASLL